MKALSFAHQALNKVIRLRLYDRAKLYPEFEALHLQKIFQRFEIDCVFDIGANKGQYAKMLRRKARFKGRIISFEPNAETAAKAAAAFSGDPLWSLEPIALSDRSGAQMLNLMRGDEFTSLSSPSTTNIGNVDQYNTPIKKIEVKTESLSAAYTRLKEHYGFRNPFLKMDTQGYDVIIARSGEDIIREFIGLQSELSIVPIYEESIPYHEAISEYERMGFSLSALVPNNAGHFPTLLETDCIMINKTKLNG